VRWSLHITNSHLYESRICNFVLLGSTCSPIALSLFLLCCCRRVYLLSSPMLSILLFNCFFLPQSALVLHRHPSIFLPCALTCELLLYFPPFFLIFFFLVFIGFFSCSATETETFAISVTSRSRSRSRLLVFHIRFANLSFLHTSVKSHHHLTLKVNVRQIDRSNIVWPVIIAI